MFIDKSISLFKFRESYLRKTIFYIFSIFNNFFISYLPSTESLNSVKYGIKDDYI
jgi:hypothetical protein